MLGSFFRGVMKRVLRPAPTTAPPFEGGGFDEWTVRGVRFDDRALRPGSASPSTMSWTDAQGAAIDLATTEDSEPIEAAALGRYRDEQRRVAHAQGRGLVSVDVRATSTGLLLLEVVTKAARGLGYDYIGRTTCSDAQHAYTISIAADEGGSTGRREAVTTSQLFELGEITLPRETPGRGGHRISGWAADPYDPEWDDGALNAVSDDERLDVLFPAHPLSRVRAFLGLVRDTLVIATQLEPTGADDRGGGVGTRDARRGAASWAAVRELWWKFERFDLLVASLQEQVTALDGPDGDRDERVADHLLLMGIVQSRRDREVNARMPLARSTAIFTALFGEGHVRTAVALTHLARCHGTLGNHAEAARLFLRALPVLEAALPNHLVLGMAHTGYATVLLAGGEAQRGMEHAMRGREIAETLGGGTRYFLLQETAGAPAPTVTTKINVVSPT